MDVKNVAKDILIALTERCDENRAKMKTEVKRRC